MPTSVHIPKPLLEAVDRRARALKISRNRLIIQALERELNQGSDWSPGFFTRLQAPSEEVKSAVEDMQSAIQKARASKKPIQW
jgi:metal-responsive CopG/Arc/MetJ family transcriptional regulator